MANYVTTLNYESQEITFQANANAPDGVGVSCPEGLCNDPSPPGSGLSVGAIIGIVPDDEFMERAAPAFAEHGWELVLLEM